MPRWIARADRECYSAAIARDGSVYSGGIEGRVTKFDGSGHFVWGWLGSLSDVRGVKIDSQQNIIAIDNGGGMAKLTPEGSLLWQRPGSQVTLFPDDSLLVTGQNYPDLMLTHYAADGSIIWRATQSSGSNVPEYGIGYAFGIHREIFVTGYISDGSKSGGPTAVFLKCIEGQFVWQKIYHASQGYGHIGR